MTGATLFSGIGAPESALPEIEWKWCAEIDPFACAVLKHHHPGVPNLGNVTGITREIVQAQGPLDVIVFGSPCQDLSVAGKRAGLKGERSGLFFRAMDIIRWSGARFALWENVPGAFSSNDGRDFAAVVGEMAGMEFDVPDGGWQNSGVAIGPEGFVEWCVLDAQHFGVPQRRRRIFALRDIGNWRDRAPILLEPESMFGNPPSRQKAREGTAGSLSARTEGGGGLGTDFEIGGGIQLHQPSRGGTA